MVELQRVEMSLSPFQSQSLISRINRGEEQEVDPMIDSIFRASVRINRLSGGMFDPTVAPLVNYWGFGYADCSDASLDSFMALVGIDSCRIEHGRMIKKHPLTEFNFSAITKGYGCDAVGRMFRRNGCSDFLIEIGGELCVAGLSPRDSLWCVMVDAPTEYSDSIVHSRMLSINVTDCGIATSGDYRNFRLTDKGRKVAHTINPRTGRPMALDCAGGDTVVLSATVVAPTAMEADALATAAMLMRPAASAEMVRRAGGRRLILAVSTPRDSLLLIDTE